MSNISPQKKRRTYFLTGITFIIFLAFMQFFRPEIKNMPVTGDIKAPDDVKAILVKGCYDCHSNNTRLSWVDQIVPVYLQVSRHVNSGRAHLNFSEWDKLTPAEQKGKLWESVNHVALGAMPRKDYILFHPSAGVTPAELTVLKKYLLTLVDHKPTDTAKINAEQSQFAEWQHQSENQTGLPVALNGIRYDPDYKNWQPLSTSERFESGTMRVILGNDIAIRAVNANKIRPWPDGARIAKALWTQITDENENTRTGAFVQLDLMIKNSRKYASTGGWGFARFKTAKMLPYGKTAQFASECINCHRPMKNEDFVFTIPLKH